MLAYTAVFLSTAIPACSQHLCSYLSSVSALLNDLLWAG